MFSSLLLIIESDNKRPEVQLTTELACKLICHRKCWSNFQWQVTRNVCFRLALNLLITSSNYFSLHALGNSYARKFYSTYIHIRLRPSCVPYVPHTKTLVTFLMGTWLEGLGLIYKFYHLMQILYLVGVGLLLNFDLLPCTESKGMLYCSAKI